jgi:hypothetical protein
MGEETCSVLRKFILTSIPRSAGQLQGSSPIRRGTCVALLCDMLERGGSLWFMFLTRTLCLLLTTASLFLHAFGAGCGTGNNESSADGGPLTDGKPLPDSGNATPPACVPTVCSRQGVSCGPAGNGCGGALQCGECTAPQTCGGGGTSSVCGGGCVPKTCAELGYNCGPAGDGCGGALSCGTCTAPQTCGGAGQSSVCGANDAGAPCVPTTCVKLGFNCGPAGDGCGGSLSCGTCTAPETCGGGGKASVCGGGCVPKTCAELGYDCGPAGDGCGGSLSCGTCTAPETCGGGGKASVCGSPASTGDASTGDAGSSGASFDYYISTTGRDSNPGTLASPWAITSLISNSVNNPKMVGKRVGLIAGTYKVAGTSGVTGATLIGNGSYPTNGSYCALSIPPGTASASTYIGSSNTSGNYSARAATVHVVSGQTSASSNYWNNAIGTNNGTGNGGYVTLDGVVIDANGMDCPGPDGNEGAHIFMTQGPGGLYTTAGTQPGVVVQNCELYGINATDSGGNDAAVFLSGDDGAIIQNNYIHDINKASQIDHAHGIEAYGSQNCQWLYNTFTNCTGGGAESKVGCFNNTSAYSYFYNDAPSSDGNAAALQGWDGGEAPDGAASTFLLHHNIFDTCGRVTFGEEYNAVHKQGLSWYNNTVYDTRSSSNGTVVLQASGAWIQHYNNLYVLSTATSGGGWQQFTSGDCTILDYDCAYALSGSYTALWQVSSKNYNSLSAFQSATGAESHGLAGTDPKFAVGTTKIVSGAGPAQFKLASGSPALGSGRVGGVASGAAVNMGAWDGTVTQIGASWVTYP